MHFDKAIRETSTLRESTSSSLSMSQKQTACPEIRIQTRQKKKKNSPLLSTFFQQLKHEQEQQQQQQDEIF